MAARSTQTRKSRPRRQATPATIHDVAARAGVSVATVSRVLNQKNVVREETRRMVADAAAALGYVPNIAARSLSSRRSHTVGVVMPDIHGEFFSEVIRGIDLAARRSGYHILVSGSHSNEREMLAVIEAMHGRVDGLLLMAPEVPPRRLPERVSHVLPLVLLNGTDGTHDQMTIDNAGGARMMMRHLAALGHRRIAFITGPAHNSDARERLRGYRNAMRTLGEPAIELAGDFSETSGHTAVTRMLAANPRPSAIFAANDAMAIGAIAALSEATIDVPREIAVAGFDDIPIARYVSPPLTTIHIDMAALGSRAFELLLAAMTKSPRRAPRRRELLDTTLIIRRSCGEKSQEKGIGKKGESS